MHSGATNASTYSQRTTYHFKVDARFLSGAMERFAGFFHSPLFRKECVGKEVNAVDSENGKNQVRLKPLFPRVQNLGVLRSLFASRCTCSSDLASYATMTDAITAG